MGYHSNKSRPRGRFRVVMVGLLAIHLFCLGLSHSYADEPPFEAGEKLTFRLRWTLVPAGEAVMEVLPMTTVNGTPAYHFRLTATSNAFVDMFYKVRDRIDAYTNTSVTRALRYHKKQHEGRHIKDIQVDFNWEEETARFFDGKKRRQVGLLPGTFDPLSAFYYIRKLDYKPNDIIICPVTDGKKLVDGEARVVKKERVTVYTGTYDTYLIEPDLKHVGGVFKKSKDAKIQVWVTADKRRIPVKIASEVAVGSFVGELSAIEKVNPLQASRTAQKQTAKQ